MTRLDEAIALLSTAKREELRDHAFGDCEVYWMKGDEEIAGGYFGASSRTVQVYFDGGQVTFEGADADRLRECGAVGKVERNDSTGPAAYREGETMPALTLDGVLKEICEPEEGQ
jgi:hypothetical protein